MDKTDICTSIDILGQSYPIKCKEEELSSLKEAAAYLENKMKEIRDMSKGFGIERVAVITALNIVHEFLHIEDIMAERSRQAQQKIKELLEKVSTALPTTESPF